MTENLNYISDDELERLICQVEENELVTAPPDLMDSILEAVELMARPEALPPTTVTVVSAASRKKEFYAYCFRVITSVAAAVVLVFLLPDLLGRLEQESSSTEQYPVIYRQEVPDYEEVVAPVPSREEVVASKPTPTKEEVLNDTGLLKRVISSTGWFSKESNNN